MGAAAIIVNGAPASGKSTLSEQLSFELQMPLISRDAIKEALADIVSVPLATSALGAIASDTLWSLVGLIDEPVIVESFWLTDRDDLYFANGLISGRITQGIEVWCEAPVDITRQRFLTRPRHPAHTDSVRLGEWEHFTRDAKPISTFPLLRVDTSGPVNVPELAESLRAIIDTTWSG